MPVRRLCGIAAIAAAAWILPSPHSLAAEPQAIDVNTRQITRFKIGSAQKRFGPLEFVGGLELTSPAGDFGSISAIRFVDRGSRFIAVTDTGFWMRGRIERDAAGRPVSMTNLRMAPMRNGKGELSGKKWETDAEGLALRGSVATASFERAHRITDYPFEGEGMPDKPTGNSGLVVPRRELRNNKGFETIAYAPRDSRLQGARVIVSERSLDPAGNIFAAIADGPAKGIFFVKRSDAFDITDGAFLPDGDLLLLERHFSMARGVAMRLRRIEAETLRAGATVEGSVMISADMSYQIDNMEGLDVWRNENGALMLSMVSDDNHSILQRNLYLEFRLVE